MHEQGLEATSLGQAEVSGHTAEEGLQRLGVAADQIVAVAHLAVRAGAGHPPRGRSAAGEHDLEASAPRVLGIPVDVGIETRARNHDNPVGVEGDLDVIGATGLAVRTVRRERRGRGVVGRGGVDEALVPAVLRVARQVG